MPTLADPPCASFFIDCIGTDNDSSDDGGSSNDSSSLDSDESGDEAVSENESGTSSSSAPSESSFFSKKPQLFAVYDVKLQNPNQNQLSGLSVSHGPVPFGATFDPDRSALGCTFLSKMTGCSADLSSAETKSFPIVYKVSNAAFCRLAPVLNSVKVSRNGSAQGSNDAPVLASVRCEVKDSSAVPVRSDAASTNAGIPASVAVGQGSSNQQGVNGSSAQAAGMNVVPGTAVSSDQTVGNGQNGMSATSSQAQGVNNVSSSGGSSGQTPDAGSGLSGNDGMNRGNPLVVYRSDASAPTPRTGAEAGYYASTKTSDSLLTQVSHTTVPSLNFDVVFWIASASFLLLLFVIKTGKISSVPEASL